MDTTPRLRQVLKFCDCEKSEGMLNHHAQNKVAHPLIVGLMVYQLQQAFSANPDRIQKWSSPKYFRDGAKSSRR